MVHKPLLSEMSETSAWNPASYSQWCIALACICSFICLLVFGAVRHFDTFYFYWLKNNEIVNKNRMSRLSSQEKHFRKGAAISVAIKWCLLNLDKYPCAVTWLFVWMQWRQFGFIFISQVMPGAACDERWLLAGFLSCALLLWVCCSRNVLQKSMSDCCPSLSWLLLSFYCLLLLELSWSKLSAVLSNSPWSLLLQSVSSSHE